MPRSGRFGRLPRRAPDLTGSIVALMREYWSTQESLMVNAWREGGEVDGKPVTDERILQFWNDRRDSVQRDDPLWDYYNNQHQQYDFAIRESEVGLKYAQKKMSAREVAKWYKAEGAKYVPDSEIYRTIMGQAAKFLDAARAGAKADATARRGKAYVKAWEATYKDDVLPASYLTTGLTWAYHNTGLLAGSVTTDQPPEGDNGAQPFLGEGADLSGLTYGAGTAQTVEQMLAMLSDPSNPMHDYFKTTFLDPAMRDGLDIDLPLNQQDLEALMSRMTSGYDHLIAINTRFDDVAPKSGAASTDNLRGQKIASIDLFQNLLVSDELAIYTQRRAAFEGVVFNDPNASLFDQAKAYGDYYKGLGTLARQVGTQNPNMIVALEAERRYLMGDSVGLTPTLAEEALFNGPAITSGGDAATLSSLGTNLQDTMEALQSGKAVAVVRGEGYWQALTPDQLAAQYGGNYFLLPKVGSGTRLTGSPDPFAHLTGQGVVTSQNITYGEVYATAPITTNAPSVSVTDPDTGTINQPGLTPVSGFDKDIGVVAYVPGPNGEQQAVYGIFVNGRTRWTTDNPFVAGATLGQQIDPQSGQLTVTLNPDFVGVPNADGSVGYNPKFGVDQTLFGPNSTRDFSEPSIAVFASTLPGRTQLAAMDVQSLVNVLGASPWVDWNNNDQVSEFWRDIGAVKFSVGSAGGNQAGGYAAENEFFNQLRGSRGLSDDLWGQIVMTEFTDQSARWNIGADSPVLLAIDKALKQNVWLRTHPGEALPGTAAPAATSPQTLPPTIYTPLGQTLPPATSPTLTPLGAGAPNTQQPYFAPMGPQINLAGYLTVPSLPGAASMPATPTPRPTVSPMPTSAPAPTPYVPPVFHQPDPFQGQPTPPSPTPWHPPGGGR